MLVLPILYVGSYLALVRTEPNDRYEYYRYGGETAAWIYWPLERIDRQFRDFMFPLPGAPVVDPSA